VHRFSGDLIWQVTRQHLIEHEPERVDVRPHVDLVRVAAYLLGAHVAEGAADGAGIRHHGRGGHVGVGDPGETEVEDFDVGGVTCAISGPRGLLVQDQDVGWFEIAVDHAALVGVGHPFADFSEHPQAEVELGGGRFIRWRPAGQPVVESLPPHQLHCKKVFTVIGAAGLIDGRDSRVLEPGEHLRLAPEEPDRRLINVAVSPDDLEGDRALWVLLFGLVYDPHPSGADQRDDSEITDQSWLCFSG